jgi:hypothetical protein
MDHGLFFLVEIVHGVDLPSKLTEGIEKKGGF